MSISFTEIILSCAALQQEIAFFSFSFLLVDILPPVISNCPASFTVNVPANNGGIDVEVAWVPPTATDNSGTTIPVLISHQPGDSFLIGQTTTVLYIYADNAGHRSQCRFYITVLPYGKYRLFNNTIALQLIGFLTECNKSVAYM